MRIRTTLLAAVAAAPLLFAQTARHFLPGQLRPGVTAANDRGRISATRSLRHVTLNLQRSGAQQAELQALLARQQDPSSPDFHKWLTPEQFGERFGMPQAEIDQITSWLESQHLTIDSVDRGRTALSFSGNVRNVEQALQVEIHDYVINGVAHFSNTADPSVPSSVGSFIASVRGLDDFRMRPRSVRGPSVPQPRYTSTTTGAHYLGPDDLAKIFDISPLYNSGITGKGQKVVVVGQTKINASDVEQFRTYFNLPVNDPTMLLVPGSTDPGVVNDDLAEADLDVEWSGAVARDAAVVYVYSSDVVTSLQYAIDQNIAPVISMSYGLCEQLSYGTLASLNSYAQQANAQGISWIAASGDNAANDCYGESSRAPAGLSVDAPASVPGVTGVGGTTLTEGSGNYWTSANNANHASALSYIPESVWNDSVLNGSPDGSGGGASTYFQKPSWQTGPGVPNDQRRDVPDISMPASPNHDPYMVYTGGVLSAFGGTSVGAPVVAGITGLLNQYLAANAAPSAGPLNPTLYSLAQTAPGAFHDIAVGDNITVACPQSTCGTVGFTAGPGYDQATGLGTLDVFNFVTAWPATLTASKKSTSVALSPSLSSLSSADTTTLTATVTGSNGVAPTGSVSFFASGTLLKSEPLAGSGSTASAVVTVSASDLGTGDNGSVVVSAVYSGDGVYGTGAGFVTLTVPTSDAMALASVTSAASFQKQYAPGMIVSLFGSNFASAIPAAPPAPLPTALGGTTVTINGIASPLYYVSPTQINVQIPWEIPKNSTAVIKVATGARSATTQVFVNKNAPEIFGDTNNLMVPYQTTRPGDPAFLFVTGDGLFSAPSVVTGAVPPGGTVTVLPTSAKVTVGGVTASVMFIGEPAWSVGVSQINFTIPANAPLGKQPVIVTIGGVSSSPVYITVSQ